MAWCYYCRRYTVNGRCPICNRMYEEPGKKYDFYGKEIKPNPPKKSSTSKSSSSSSGTSYSNPYFWPGFFLGLGINFGAIMIAKHKNKKMLSGAITGMVINSIITIQVIIVLINAYLYSLGIPNQLLSLIAI